jgi:hypothetical protein
MILNVSGEVVPYTLIQVEVLPSILNVVVPAWHDFGKWEKDFNEKYLAKLGQF